MMLLVASRIRTLLLQTVVALVALGLPAAAQTRAAQAPDEGSAGDVGRGKVIFEGKGRCATCHRVNGKGSRVAPDLSDAGVRGTAAALRRSLVDPTGSMKPINRSVRAVTKEGKTITGRRLNEDTHSVQLIDSQERLVSLEKANLREYEVIKTSPMPSYKDTLTSQELGDVVAYLLSLKGLE
jgi:cytochrome c oxidase cbb3-type subunit III